MTWRMAKTAVVLGLSAVLASACGTTTTLYRSGAAPTDATLVGGTPRSVIVESDAGREEIPRSDIYEFDYPGNVHANIGGVLVGYGILNIAVGLPKCDDRPADQRAAFCAGVLMPAALGVGMLIWGLTTNRQAKTAAADTGMISMLPDPAPSLGRDRRALPGAVSAVPSPVVPAAAGTAPTVTPAAAPSSAPSEK